MRICDWHVDYGAGYLSLHWHHHHLLRRSSVRVSYHHHDWLHHLWSRWLNNNRLLLFLNYQRWWLLGVRSWIRLCLDLGLDVIDRLLLLEVASAELELGKVDENLL